MSRLSAARFGVAVGTAIGITFAVAICVMKSVPRDAAVASFNRVFRGFNVDPILRPEMPVSEMVIGVFGVVVLGRLFGAMIGFPYKVSARFIQ